MLYHFDRKQLVDWALTMLDNGYDSEHYNQLLKNISSF